MNDRDQWHLLELTERSLDGRLSDSERSELNSLLRGSDEARQLFARAMHQHAELRFDERLTRDLTQPLPAPVRTGFLLTPRLLRIAAVVVLLGVAATAWMWSSSRGGRDQTIATVIKARQCKWAGSTLPTAEGSRVTAGTLELVEGIATVKFDSGAEVVMEAPATLELTHAMACKLVRGTLVADVPPSAIGFTVDTPDAKVVDYGTRFGVSTGEDGKYHVQVLEGLVEVSSRDAQEPKKLRAGESVDTGLRRSQLNPQTHEQEPNRWQPTTILDAGDGWQIVSTAFGRGKDTYIQSNPKTTKVFGRDPFFRVKHSSHAPELNRKSYVAFDVNRFSDAILEDAELVLSIEPSDLGFATLVPDSTFAVYGLMDESEDAWAENEVTWNQAPAHDPAQEARHLPAPSKSVLLGKFEIPQGVSRGTRTLRGQALVDFLKKDTNGLVTFIICRETDETTRDGLVHAFATKENSRNTPPLLRVKTRP
jgi:ferric-dicitrate binding protein FerR (iron transport regulator)